MDLTILLAISTIPIVIVLTYYFLKGRHNQNQESANLPNGEERRREVAAPRNARARLRAAAAQRDPDDDNDYEDLDQDKLGAKKRAKLEAKAEKKAQREADEKDREDKKKRKEYFEEERKRQEEKENLDEQKREEAEKKAREEQERREHEEYLKMKASFNIEEEGFDETEIQEDTNLLEKFIDHIKYKKVLEIEDLASKFKMKTQSVIDRIKDLQSDKRLTGVMDDRGKYIYITNEELISVAKFVKQRGRVSITELVENSQKLILLRPNKLED